jgi:Ca2+-transporting ATPase
MPKHFYQLSIEETLKELKTEEDGLTEPEAKSRREIYGVNEIREKKKVSWFRRFLNQFKNFLVIILILATIVSAALGEILDALVILIIVVLNAVFGFIQEYKAEKAIESLKKLSAPKTKVIRNGKEKEIWARELVPGDIVVLGVGDRVPADCRIIEYSNLKIDESFITGESTPVVKHNKAIEKETPVSDRKNMLLMGSLVVYGHCKAVVVKIGMKTEIGRIAHLIQTAEEKKTPLQQKLESFGKRLGIIILGICGVIFVTGLLKNKPILEMFMVAVSLAVAAIPEGLPAIVTITLALGIQRMAKRNAIIRKLPAVEALGCTTVICSDKTGTLTLNKMTVQKLFTDDKEITVTGEGYSTEGSFYLNEKEIDPLSDKNVSLLLTIGALCNDAELQDDDALGDPTEGALLAAAYKAGIDRDIKKKYTRVFELSFDSERKSMTTVHDIGGQRFAYVKGAPEKILERCMTILKNGDIHRLSTEDRKKITEINQKFTSQSLRVLAMAFKRLKPSSVMDESLETDLVFVGLQAMKDPAREEVKEAIQKCKSAGIRVIMITGDHKLTAMAIGRELGMPASEEYTIAGQEIEKMSESELDEIVKKKTIYARVSPEDKVRIIKAIKKKGHIVAMTGDGVNDAPALQIADIAIAMGITGTDVAKEASDMILADDNFATIEAAVEEGRGIYDNIKKSIRYLLSCNVGEVLTIFLATLADLPLPLLPIQILWMNLVTDGLPALALGMDTADPDIMQRPPRDPKENILSRRALLFIFIVGAIMSLSVLVIYVFELQNNPLKAQTIAFTTIILAQMFISLSSRSERHTLKKIGFFTNKILLVAICAAVLLQVFVIYTPFLQPIFKTVELDIYDWLKIIFVSSAAFIAIELKKYLINRKK